MLMVGGGAAGISAALGLASLGHRVYLVEKEDRLGGRAVTYGCKATDECLLCGLCSLSDLLCEIEQEPLVEIMTGTQVQEVAGQAGDFRVSVEEDSGSARRDLAAGAIVLAVGFEPFDARIKGEFGYGRYPAVITALEAEESLRDKGRILASDGAEPKRVAFIQCVGSRDVSLGRPYCSRVCCAYALRLAAVLRHNSPDCEVTVFYMDFQPLGKKFEMIRQALAADKKVRLLMSMPAKIYGWEGEREVEVKYLDPATGGLTAEAFDLVILSIGLGGPAVNSFASALGRTEDGFLAENGGGGIFLAGSCSGPRTIGESISEGRRSALRVAMSIKGGQ